MTKPTDDLDSYLDKEFNEPEKTNKADEQEEFMRMLQQNMSKLLAGELDQEEIKSLQSPEKPKEFQDTISQTMNKLKASKEEAQAKVGESGLGFDDASMEKMVKELEGLMETGDFEDVFGGVLQQLVSKELLHEPMKELAEKYPGWLKENKQKISSDDYSRYVMQYEKVQEINAVFESTTEAELNDEQAKVVLELMQEMQGHGNPPADLMEDMAPGMEMGSDGLPNMPEGVPDCKSM